MNTGLKNKLLSFEVNPPDSVWKKITSSLDETVSEFEFSSRLYEAEIPPPPSTWNKISTVLNTQPLKSESFNKRILPFAKYAAAAIVIGLFTWGGIQLINSKGRNAVTAEKIPNEKKESLPTLINPPVNSSEEITLNENESAATNEARNDAALEASKKTYAKLDIPARSKIMEIASGFEFNADLHPENILPHLSNTLITNSTDLASCYITLKTPDGNTIRMSNKLNDMICCVIDENTDQECSDQMKIWREKAICLPANNTSGGFMDILSLVKTLQEN